MRSRAKAAGLLILCAGLIGGVAVAQQAPASPPAAPSSPAPATATPTPATPPAAATPAPAAPAATEPAPIDLPPPVKKAAPPPPKPKDEPPPKPKEPKPRVRKSVAILQGLDKITAETLRFEAPLNRPIRYKNLIVTVKACETNAPDEPVDDAMAYLNVISQPKVQGGRVAPSREVYRGWMFANSPGVSPRQHPVYDVWLIACRS